MRNAEIADALNELATLYELDGAIRYRVLAYREAARVIRQSPVSAAERAEEHADDRREHGEQRGKAPERDGCVGPGDRVRDQQADSVERPSHEPPVGPAPAVTVL